MEKDEEMCLLFQPDMVSHLNHTLSKEHSNAFFIVPIECPYVIMCEAETSRCPEMF